MSERLSDLDAARLPERTKLGGIQLTVASMQRALDFYARILGYLPKQRGDGTVALLPSEGYGPHFILAERPGAEPKPWRAAGLFHSAILLPSRVELARVLRQLAEAGWKIDGMSDHGVSEALYLSDPDKNGVEIYADRPRSNWPRQGETIEMVSERLDLEGLLAELESDPRPWNGLPDGSTIGHIHLQVTDLAQSEAFYSGLIGFDVVQRSYPGALFISAGGYHHHIGMNTWAGVGVPTSPKTSAGLTEFTILLPDKDAVDQIESRLNSAGEAVSRKNGSILTRDPNNIGVVIAVGPE